MSFLGWLDSKAAGAPRWLTRGAGGDLLRATAVTLDAAVDSIKQGVKARFPGRSPPDGLALIAAERQQARATAIVYENDFAFAARLRRLWRDVPYMGAAEGLRRVLVAMGCVDFSIYHHGEWGLGLPWQTWVSLRSPQPWGPPKVLGGGWVLGDGSTLGSSATVGQVRNVREVTASWVPPHTEAYLVIKTADGPVLGDGWVLGDGTALENPGLCAWRLGEETL